MCSRCCLAFSLDRRGAAAVEFALVLPLFLMTLFGIFDYGMQFYGKHVLQGAVSQSARNSTLETHLDDQDDLDDVVKARVHQIFAGAELQFKRRAYLTYEDVGKAERIIHKSAPGNSNDRLDPGECFIDANGSGQWEADRGRIGNGGPDDIVFYEVTMEFDRMFPFWALVGQPQKAEMTASTLLRNQPYAKATVEAREICT